MQLTYLRLLVNFSLIINTSRINILYSDNDTNNLEQVILKILEILSIFYIKIRL